MSKDFIKSQIAGKRSELERVRGQIARERDAKRVKMDQYSRAIASAATPSQKSYNRERKIAAAEICDRQIEQLKKQVERITGDIARLRESMQRA